MKRFLKRFIKLTWHGIPIGIIASVLIGTAVLAVGLYTLTVPSTITVTPAQVVSEPHLGIYSNIECTEEVTSFTVGSVEVGETVYVSKVWVKNTGDKDFTEITVTTDLDIGIATMSVPGWPKALLSGEETEANIAFKGVGETTSSQSFNIMFNGSY